MIDLSKAIALINLVSDPTHATTLGTFLPKFVNYDHFFCDRCGLWPVFRVLEEQLLFLKRTYGIAICSLTTNENNL